MTQPPTPPPRRARAPSPAHPGGLWTLQMLGGLQARNGDQLLQRLPTRAVARLLVRLALQLGRAHPREELAELLWPSDTRGAPLAPQAQRNRLRNALSTLRALLEPPGHGAGPVLLADAWHARLNAALVQTDVDQFEALCRSAAGNPAALAAARQLYRGELLPGFDDDWIRDRRQQLATLYEALAPAQPAAEARHQAVRLARPGYAGKAAQRVELPGAGAAQRRLPGYVTPFFGREAELAQLQRLLAQHRLVQIVGPGGCGKTRLAVQWALQDKEGDSLHLVALQDCSQPERVLEHVRAVLDLQATRTAALEQVVDRLQDRPALLILDCCEHLLQRGTLQQTVHTLLERLPRLKLLLTSRRALQPGSPQLTLRPLPVPAEASSAAQAMHSAAVRLFVDRARAVRADFALHARNVGAVLQLCRLLDGLPVLIEIAASRVRHFAPAALCAALADSVGVLQRTGPAARKAGRHASVHALLEWSWRQLGAPQRAMLGAVVVFRGGWTLQAAADVAGCSLAQCAARLQELADHQLLHSAVDASGQARWQMLGVVREQLQAWVPADEAATHRQRLREHLLAWAQSLQARHAPFPMQELQNVEAALASALADGDAPTGMALALALQWPWVASGASAAVLQWLDALALHLPQGAAQPGSNTGMGNDGDSGPTPELPVAPAFHAMRARLLMLQGHGQAAQQAAERALQEAGSHPAARADALQALTSVRWRLAGDPAAVLAEAEETHRLALAHGPPQAQARAASLLGAVRLVGGDAAAAQALFGAAQALCQAAGDSAGALAALPGLISCLQEQGQHADAIAHAQGALAQARQLDQVETQLLLLNRLSTGSTQLRRHRQVVRFAQQQLQLARQHGLAYHQIFALWDMAPALLRLRQPRSALLLMACARAWWLRSFGPLQPGDEATVDALRAGAARQLGAAQARALWQQGEALTSAQALELAASV